MFLYIIIIIVASLLALVVLAQNPKGGGLAAGFTGAQQIGGVQRTTDFLEKSTWTLAAVLIILCLLNVNPHNSGAATGDGPGDAPIQVDDQPAAGAPTDAAPADDAGQ